MSMRIEVTGWVPKDENAEVTLDLLNEAKIREGLSLPFYGDTRSLFGKLTKQIHIICDISVEDV